MLKRVDPSFTTDGLESSVFFWFWWGGYASVLHPHPQPTQRTQQNTTKLQNQNPTRTRTRLGCEWGPSIRRSIQPSSVVVGVVRSPTQRTRPVPATEILTPFATRTKPHIPNLLVCIIQIYLSHCIPLPVRISNGFAITDGMGRIQRRQCPPRHAVAVVHSHGPRHRGPNR
jgi:hypothetical protein